MHQKGETKNTHGGPLSSLNRRKQLIEEDSIIDLLQKQHITLSSGPLAQKLLVSSLHNYKCRKVQGKPTIQPKNQKHEDLMKLKLKDQHYTGAHQQRKAMLRSLDLGKQSPVLDNSLVITKQCIQTRYPNMFAMVNTTKSPENEPNGGPSIGQKSAFPLKVLLNHTYALMKQPTEDLHESESTYQQTIDNSDGEEEAEQDNDREREETGEGQDHSMIELPQIQSRYSHYDNSNTHDPQPTSDIVHTLRIQEKNLRSRKRSRKKLSNGQLIQVTRANEAFKQGSTSKKKIGITISLHKSFDYSGHYTSMPGSGKHQESFQPVFPASTMAYESHKSSQGYKTSCKPAKHQLWPKSNNLPHFGHEQTLEQESQQSSLKKIYGIRDSSLILNKSILNWKQDQVKQRQDQSVGYDTSGELNSSLSYAEPASTKNQLSFHSKNRSLVMSLNSQAMELPQNQKNQKPQLLWLNANSSSYYPTSPQIAMMPIGSPSAWIQPGYPSNDDYHDGRNQPTTHSGYTVVKKNKKQLSSILPQPFQFQSLIV